MTPDFPTALAVATGSGDPDVQDWVLRQAATVEAVVGGPGADRPEEQDRRTIALLCGVLEGGLADSLIAAEMLALHKAAMSCLRRTCDPDLAGRTAADETRLAAQLMTLATRQATLLARHREARAAVRDGARRAAARDDAAAARELAPTVSAGPASAEPVRIPPPETTAPPATGPTPARDGEHERGPVSEAEFSRPPAHGHAPDARHRGPGRRPRTSAEIAAALAEDIEMHPSGIGVVVRRPRAPAPAADPAPAAAPAPAPAYERFP